MHTNYMHPYTYTSMFCSYVISNGFTGNNVECAAAVSKGNCSYMLTYIQTYPHLHLFASETCNMPHAVNSSCSYCCCRRLWVACQVGTCEWNDSAFIYSTTRRHTYLLLCVSACSRWVTYCGSAAKATNHTMQREDYTELASNSGLPRETLIKWN